MVLSDGSIVTKDLRLEGQGRSTITRLSDKLELMHEPFLLPEGSMGRIASDKNDDFFAKPRAIAEEMYKTVLQDKSTWSFRVELRPFGEIW